MNNPPECYVGFDTSNYTTSAAVVNADDGRVVANIKKPLPVNDGACGLRQSDAVFAHIRNIPDICRELRRTVAGRTVLAVGVSEKPRDAEDSYMPCFLSGVAEANAFAAACNAPVFGFSHQGGHIRAAVYSAGAEDVLLRREFLAFHVSGGTTDLLSVKPLGVGFKIDRIGGSKDINAGQAIDRAGVMMGMKFPCGPELERCALEFDGVIPKPKICVGGCECNLSGLQNVSEKLWKETQDKTLVSRFVLEFVGKTLWTMTGGAREVFGDIPVLYAGGVMSNSIIKKILSAREDTYFAEPEFSSDNAAGIALLCRDINK